MSRTSIVHRVLTVPLLLFGISLLAAAPALAAEGSTKPLRIAICVGQGKEPLLEFKKYLEANYRVQCELIEAEKAPAGDKKGEFRPTPFQNLAALADSDLILSNLYRTWAPPAELEQLQQAFRSKPVVGLRKAHHGFQNWLDADGEVFGVDYQGHYFGKNVQLKFAPGAGKDPIVGGLKLTMPAGGLYAHKDVAKDVEVLLIGGPEDMEPLPQSWRRLNKERDQRVFYTRYDPEDLQQRDVRDMVVQAIFWAAGVSADSYRK